MSIARMTRVVNSPLLGFDLFGTEVFGELAEVFGEAIDVIGIRIVGSRREITHEHVFGHPPSDGSLALDIRGHGVSLCECLKGLR